MAFGPEPPLSVPLQPFLVFGPHVGVDGSHVNRGACGGQERGAGDDVVERRGGEPQGSIGREQGERLDVDGVVRGGVGGS